MQHSAALRRTTALLIGVVGCGPATPSLEPLGVQWFTYGIVASAHAAPEAERMVVVVDDDADSAGPAAPSTARRGAVFTFAPDGERKRHDVLQDAVAVAIDDRGTTFAVVHDDAIRRDETCRVIAVHDDGDTRGFVDAVACTTVPVVTDELVVLRAGLELEARSDSAERVWQGRLPHECDALRWREGALWCSSPRNAEVAAIVRCEPADGSCRSIPVPMDDAETPVQVVAFDVSRRTIVARRCTADWAFGRCELVGFDVDGDVRWTQRDGGTLLDLQLPVVSARGVWIVERDSEPPTGTTAGSDMIRFRHLGGDGDRDAQLRRRFVDDADVELDRSTCPDPPFRIDFGSRATQVVPVQGGMLVVGRQGCRDGFVIALQEGR